MVSGTTRVFATLGRPNLGNPAPAVYNAAFDAGGVDAVYVALEPADIGAAMQGVRSLGLGGATITAPFKQQVMAYVDVVDDDARAIGAVNVVQNHDGTLVGRNSDWLGALGALREAVDPQGRRVALLGAGGAARAVAFGLQRAGAHTTVFNRTAERAKAMCEHFGCAYGGGLDAVTPDFDVVINATSVGMGERVTARPVRDDALGNVPVVFDLVARPRRTLLLERARERGCVTVEGIAMVAHQAVPALEWLTGVTPDLAVMKAHFG